MTMFDNPIKPMEPKFHATAFDSRDHVFQVKWDGVRMLAFINGNGVRLQNRKLRDKTAQYPDLADANKHIKGENAVFDGEMIALKDGKPSFSRILQRDLCVSPSKIKSVSAILPVIYMVFDVLYYNGKPLIDLPWQDRHSVLESVVMPTENLQITENFFHHGQQFFQAIKAQDLEGMIAKKISSPYLIGQKHSHWLKIKRFRDLNCVVGGYIIENSRLKSLLVGCYRQDQLIYLGRVSSGLTFRDMAALLEHLPTLSAEKSPFINAPRKAVGWFWTAPVLTIKVEFMEITEDFQLRHPVIKGFISIDPKDCVLFEEDL